MFQGPGSRGKEVINNVLATKWPLATARFAEKVENPQHLTRKQTPHINCIYDVA
jgi:hypothetical protein